MVWSGLVMPIGDRRISRICGGGEDRESTGIYGQYSWVSDRGRSVGGVDGHGLALAGAVDGDLSRVGSLALPGCHCRDHRHVCDVWGGHCVGVDSRSGYRVRVFRAEWGNGELWKTPCHVGDTALADGLVAVVARAADETGVGGQGGAGFRRGSLGGEP